MKTKPRQIGTATVTEEAISGALSRKTVPLWTAMLPDGREVFFCGEYPPKFIDPRNDLVCICGAARESAPQVCAVTSRRHAAADFGDTYHLGGMEGWHLSRARAVEMATTRARTYAANSRMAGLHLSPSYDSTRW